MDDKVVIVSGAARGTGAATARLLASEGAQVVIGDLLEEQGRQVAKEIGASARFHPLDVTKEASWQALVDVALAAHGRIDALVNNAAVLLMCALVDTSVEAYERVVMNRTNRLYAGGRRLNLPWPKALGTPPWGAKKELEFGASRRGTTYTVQLLRAGLAGRRRTG